MFTQYTMTDWQEAIARGERDSFLQKVITAYKGSADFAKAREAEGYFTTDRMDIDSKVILKAKKVSYQTSNGQTKTAVGNDEIVGCRISGNFFAKFVQQECSFLLGNGVTLDSPETKTKLGIAFDTVMQSIGRKALIQAVCYGYWNVDHIEQINAYTDSLSGGVPLLDEMNGQIGVFIHFWQLDEKRPQYIRLFELDGVTILKKDGEKLVEVEPKRPYKLKVREDFRGITIEGGENYPSLPIVPLYGNAEHRSELTKAIKSKIDLYNTIASDFGDNLEKANDVLWVLNNFGGDAKELVEMVETIRKLGIIANQDHGGSASTAQPQAFQVPYEARQVALSLLEKQLYSDYMAMNMDEIRGGSLTNVAIKVAMTNLNLKCDAFEWECFTFVQRVLGLIGITTEQIRFKRRTLVNDEELINSIYAMRSDIDLDTALKLNPLIEQDDIETIKKNLDAEGVSGLPSMEDLQRAIDKQE